MVLNNRQIKTNICNTLRSKIKLLLKYYNVFVFNGITKPMGIRFHYVHRFIA